MKKFSLTLLLFIAYITIAFAQQEIKKHQDSFNIDSLKKERFDFVSIETQPEFPGGLSKFYKYLSNNTKYPKAARKDKIGGKVILSFVIEKDGHITEVEVLKGIRDDLDAEAVNVILRSPNWSPGIQSGKAVRVKYNIDVNFNLNK